MINLPPPSRIIQGIVLLLILFVVSCDESSLSRERISQDQLDAIVSKREDFNSFIELHYQNKVAIAAMDEEQSEKLSAFYQNIENGANVDPKEVASFLSSIGFKPISLDFLISTKEFLGSKYTYDSDDLDSIIIVRLDDYSRNFRAQFVISCDTYCTRRAEEKYPKDSDDPQWNATARAIYYAGCLDGCQNGPNAQ